MARESEFLSLSDAALRAVIGPQSRHLALIEDAFKVLVETPGGGVSINGSTRDRAQARRVIEALSNRAEAGAEITEADVRTALGAAVTQPRAEPAGRTTGRSVPEGAALPVGRRGAIAPKTASQARYLEMLGRCELTFGVGPAGTGKTFLAAAYGASLLKRGQVDRLVITRPEREGRPLSGADLGVAERHPRRRRRAPPSREGRDRGRPHRLHARPHPQPRLHHRR
jgi:phosphate starvation-inducible PhoH-like protein